jgi:ATP-dependent Clp protease protease subunit
MPLVPMVIQQDARESQFLRRRMEEIYAEHTGRSRDEISRDIERDRFLTPAEAVDYGLIDTVHVDRNGNGYSSASSSSSV